MKDYRMWYISPSIMFPDFQVSKAKDVIFATFYGDFFMGNNAPKIAEKWDPKPDGIEQKWWDLTPSFTVISEDTWKDVFKGATVHPETGYEFLNIDPDSEFWDKLRFTHQNKKYRL